MIDYDSATDDEINEAVLCHTVDPIMLPYYQNGTNKIPGYCNSWADAGPIIEDNKIAVIPMSAGTEEFWRADKLIGEHPQEYIESRNTNPRRAAMIVFLKLKEAEA